MIVVADASPLIFLSKLRRMELIRGVCGGDIRVPRSVASEVLAPAIDPVEERVLRTFLRGCRVEAVARPRTFATGMSPADSDALTLAVRCRADFLLCDEHLTRLMAETEGVRPLGTLGILVRAQRANRLTRAETRRLVDELVREHGFRIGVELYQAVCAAIEAG